MHIRINTNAGQVVAHGQPHSLKHPSQHQQQAGTGFAINRQSRPFAI